MRFLVVTVVAGGVILGVAAAFFFTGAPSVQIEPALQTPEVSPRLQLEQDISALIEGLRDSDYEDRDICNRQLVLLTGLSFDFKSGGLPEERESAINRWQEWWNKNKGRKKEEWLIEAVKDNNYQYRLAALKELRRLRTPVAATVFVQLLKEQNVDLRKESVEALGELSLKETVPAILETLADSEPEVRRRAARALGAIGSTDAVAALLSRSEDADLLVRVEVAGALVKLSEKDAFPALILLLKSGDTYAASFAAESISVCADRDSVPILAPLLPEVKPPARAKLLRALQKITGESLGEDPKEWLKWYENCKSQQ